MQKELLGGLPRQSSIPNENDPTSGEEEETNAKKTGLEDGYNPKRSRVWFGNETFVVKKKRLMKFDD